MKPYTAAVRSVRPFTCLIILWLICMLFVTLPSHYYLYVTRRREWICSEEGHDSSIFFPGVKHPYSKSNSADLENQEKMLRSLKAGTPDESTIFIVPRHRKPPFVPYVEVVNRNKFESLFRDHGSSNPLQERLTDEDKLPDRFTNRKGHKSPWKQFYEDINRYQLYSFNSSIMMTSLMTYLQESTAHLCTQMKNTPQINLNITFMDGGKAAMKPWRVPREYQTIPDHQFIADIERHTAKIAAFHLDRILDFRRVPPITGRFFNITSEISTCASGRVFVKSFFTSPANNSCFTTDCDDYCEISKTPVCGTPELVEGSVEIFLPPPMEGQNMSSWIYPWRRLKTNEINTYEWERNSSFCHGDVTLVPEGRRILDLIDLAIFDFLIGNSVRQHYHTFSKFGIFASLIHLDHGRAFGNYKKDYLSCLAPLVRCCFVRNSTYHRLSLLNKDEYKLSDVMRESLSTDPIAPVLYEPHYDALNRRLSIVIDAIDKCIDNASSSDIVLKKEPRLEEFVQRSKV